MDKGEGTPYCASCGRVKKAKRINGKLQSKVKVYKQPTCGTKKCIKAINHIPYESIYQEKNRPAWESVFDDFNFRRTPHIG